MPGPFQTFGSSSISPGQSSYASIALTGSITLAWPNFAGVGSNVISLIMDLTANAGGYSITFPDARQAGNGTSALLFNKGAQSITILANDGSALTTVAAGVAKFLYLADNSTQAGTWTVVTFGTGTSAADATALAGFGLQAIAATLNQSHPTVTTSSTITVSAPADLAKVYVAIGGSVAANLPTSASAGPNFFTIIKNNGTGTVTITPSGADTIDGVATLALAPNDAAMICSLGSSNGWVSIGWGRSVSFAFTQLVKSVAGSADVTLSAAECANKLITLTGALTGNINVIVTNTVSVYYIFNNTSGAFSLTVKTAAGAGIAIAQGTHDIAACDGTNVYRALTNTSATTAFSAGSAGAPSVTFVGSTDSGLYLAALHIPAISASGFEVMSFNGPAASVNWMDAFAAATGVNPKFIANGTDPNVGLRMQMKGTGKFQLTDGTDTTKVAQFDESLITTASLRTIKVPDADTFLPIATQFLTFSGPTAARTYTLPDANLTIPAVTAKGDSWHASASGVMAKVVVGTDGQIQKAASGQAAGVQWVDNVSAIAFIIDGGGSAITTGIKGDLSIPFGCTITGVRLLADQSGSIVVDIWKDTYANYPPTVADTITAAAKPTITTATKSEDTTLTGWTKAIAAGDTLRFNVDSITTCQRVVLTLTVTKT